MNRVAERPAIAFQRMGARQLTGVEALESDRPDSSWTERTFRDEMGGRNRHYVVALVDGEVIGYAGLLVQAGEGHVTTLMVDPSHRRRGLATDLMNELIGAACYARCEAMTLEVSAGNQAAMALYRAFGFVEEGSRPNYYPDGTDAAIMWRRQVDAPTPHRDPSEQRTATNASGPQPSDEATATSADETETRQ